MEQGFETRKRLDLSWLQSLVGPIAVLIAVGACDDNDVAETCDDEECRASCIDQGNTGGNCSNRRCDCIGATDGDADVDSDSDADDDLPVDGDLDSDSDEADTDEPCIANCDGLECGSDGCGGDCLDPARECAAGERPWCRSDGRFECVDEVWIPLSPGVFMMGSPEDESGRVEDESRHEVTLTHEFLIHSTEVTQGQFEAVMGYDPSRHLRCSEDCPVDQVSWHESAAYCNALSAAAGLEACYECTGEGRRVECTRAGAFASPYACPGYRLPTEAEWEYAARAGDDRLNYAGVDDASACSESPGLEEIAWYCANSRGTTHDVASLRANEWGLHDVFGNIWEWCHDSYVVDLGSDPVFDPCTIEESALFVLRGGSAYDPARVMRASVRLAFTAGGDLLDFGFRPVRSVP